MFLQRDDELLSSFRRLALFLNAVEKTIGPYKTEYHNNVVGSLAKPVPALQRSWRPQNNKAEKDTSDLGEGSPSRSEAQNFAVMFKAVMSEMKELKQTVASLLEPVDDGECEDNTAESNDLEGAATPVGGKEPNAGETSKTPAATASGSKLLAEIVQDLDIEEKTGNDVDEGLVKLLNGLLKDKLQGKNMN